MHWLQRQWFPIIKQICASSETELAEMAVKALLKSERRSEFVADLPVVKTIPTFGKYAAEWMKTPALQGFSALFETDFVQILCVNRPPAILIESRLRGSRRFLPQNAKRKL